MTHPARVTRRKATLGSVDQATSTAVPLYGEVTTSVVASQAAALALTDVVAGDIVVRSDLNAYYTNVTGLNATWATDWALVTDGVAVPYLADIYPFAGDICFLDIVGDSPMIVGRVPHASVPVDWQQHGSISYTFASEAAHNFVVSLPLSYLVAPTVVLHSIEVGSSLDVLSNLVSKTTTSLTIRAFQRTVTPISGAVTLHWITYGK